MTEGRKPRVIFVDDEEDLAASLAAKYSKEYDTGTTSCAAAHGLGHYWRWGRVVGDRWSGAGERLFERGSLWATGVHNSYNLGCERSTHSRNIDCRLGSDADVLGDASASVAAYTNGG